MIYDSEDLSVHDCIQRAMASSIIINSLYCSGEIDKEQYFSLLEETRNIATSFVLSKFFLQSIN
jgi:hypothetical protein